MKTLNVRLDDDDHEKLLAQAKENLRSANAQITWLIRAEAIRVEADTWDDAEPATEIVPVTTAGDYNDSMGGMEYLGVTFVEHEDGDITAYGHVEPDRIATAVNRYYTEAVADQEPIEASDVKHGYGVLEHAGRAADDGWFVTWNGITAETPLAFPLTHIPAP